MLVQLGVAQDFIELPVENFYNMMLDLPAKDPTGELSASVYISCIRSLASNKDILKKFDSDCLARKRFMILGKLSAKQTTNSKEQPSFQPIKEVYFTNKAVPNISGKYLLNVPVKNGSLEDMKLLFGVQQFKEDIQIDATREPVNSRYDKEFQKKLAAYMPYAYCLRVGKASENEKSQFRRLEIHLAKSLYVQTGDAPSQPFTGDAYTIFKKNPTSWYIYIGDLKYDDFELSKKMEDIFEVLCNLQDRDFLTKYRELYSNSERRDSLIEYYGYSQEELNESKQFFKLCDTERNKVIRYLESISFDKIDEAKEKIKEVYLGKTDSAAEQLLLLQFMKFTGIHLKVLKEIVGVELDIQLALKKLLGNAYTNNLHNIFGYHMKEKCKENQDHFLSKWYEVRSNIKEYTGILDESMNPEEFIGERFKEIFGIQLNCEEQVEDISRIYEENFAYIRNNTEKKSDFDDFISAEKYRSRLFYGWESVKDDFDKYLDTLGTQSPEKTGDNPNSTDDYEDEPDLVIPVHSEGDSSGKRDKPSGAVTKKGAANKQRIGDAAELLVFNLLKAHKISKIEEWIGKPFQVKWISGAAARHDQPSADIDDGAGYDMQLIAEDDENDIYYVEVKGTTGSSCEFFMSANELKLAEAESSQNRYRLIFVSNIKQGQKRGINVLNPLEKIFHKDASEYIFSYNA